MAVVFCIARGTPFNGRSDWTAFAIQLNVEDSVVKLLEACCWDKVDLEEGATP